MKAAETVSFLRLSSALLGQQRLHEYGAHSSGGVLVLHTGCRNASAAEVTACIELWEDIFAAPHSRLERTHLSAPARPIAAQETSLVLRDAKSPRELYLLPGAKPPSRCGSCSCWLLYHANQTLKKEFAPCI